LIEDKNGNIINNNLYVCPYCLKEMNRLTNLKSHIKKNHLFYGLYCPYCIEFYGTISKFQSHLVMKNDDYHQNLYYLITKRYTKRVNKKIFMKGEKKNRL